MANARRTFADGNSCPVGGAALGGLGALGCCCGAGRRVMAAGLVWLAASVGWRQLRTYAVPRLPTADGGDGVHLTPRQ
ncbi:hypothetical protein KCP74_02870 [Salmonella enterica subsp. enterica]|nr:hypothetical protein KCP74_02870 [Salmonella enterica subsp. enterica]